MRTGVLATAFILGVTLATARGRGHRCRCRRSARPTAADAGERAAVMPRLTTAMVLPPVPVPPN